MIIKKKTSIQDYYTRLAKTGLQFKRPILCKLNASFKNVWFGIKSAILGSAVYYSIEKGVWKDSATTTALYEDLEKGASPYVGELKKKIPYEFPPLPSNDRVSYLMKYYWNSGVKATFRFLAELPTHVSDLTIKTYDLVVTALDSADPSSTSENKEKVK